MNLENKEFNYNDIKQALKNSSEEQKVGEIGATMRREGVEDLGRSVTNRVKPPVIEGSISNSKGHITERS